MDFLAADFFAARFAAGAAGSVPAVSSGPSESAVTSAAAVSSGTGAAFLRVRRVVVVTTGAWNSTA